MADQTNPIPRVTRDDPAAHSGDVVTENISALKALFPGIVTDGKVDFGVLRQLLGDEVEEGAERYGLNWKGKARARAFALTPSLGTLRPAKGVEESKNWEATRNIVIEGDNLEVLKLLRKSYAGKVDLIYIDPPYNTGDDFVYPDNYSDSIAHYQVMTGQRNEDGALLTSQVDTSGRRHTRWLNMMYPRLMVAKELLADKALILVSIADEEIANLDLLMSQVFGEERRAAIIHRRKNRKPHNAGGTISTSYEFIVAYYATETFKLVQDFAEMKQDEKGQYAIYPVIKGDKRLRVYTMRKGMPVEGSAFRKGVIEADRNSNLNISVLDEPEIVDGFLQNDVRVEGRFCLTDENGALSEAMSEGNIFINSNGFPKEKRYRTDEDRKIDNHHWDIAGGKNEDGDDELKGLFKLTGDNDIFKYPKPTGLICKALQSAASSNALVLDFFAGSGTTAHAVMLQNAKDGGNRRFLIVQIPECLDPGKKEQKAAAEFCAKLGKPRNIAELTKERLRRAGDKVKADHPGAEIDTGFRVYKLASSNLKPWQPSDDLAADLLDATSNVLPGRSEDDLLVELLLKTGIDLALPGETRTIAERTVHSLGGGTLIICLADVPATQARALGDGIADWLDELAPPAPTTFFFKDSGFDAGGNRAAEARANLAATLRQRLGDEAIEKLGAI